MTPEQRRRLTVENRDNIQLNAEAIVKNRKLLIDINIIIVIAIAAISFYNQHNIHDCEERLFEKLTNMKSPIIKEEK